MKKNKPQKTRQEINEESRLQKKKRKHKGLPSGAKFNVGSKSSGNSTKEANDPRIGSKIPIPLIVESINTTKVKKDTIKLSPKQELEALENSTYLEQLLDLVEDNQDLTSKQQKDLDKMLDRINVLMKKLGYSEDDDESFDNDSDIDELSPYSKKEDIVSLLKKS